MERLLREVHIGCYHMEIPSPLAVIFTGLSTKLRSSLQFLWETCGFQAKFLFRAPVDACHNEGGGANVLVKEYAICDIQYRYPNHQLIDFRLCRIGATR